MVSGTDTGNLYALQAERYYDVPDEEPRTCSECDSFDECPCPSQCHWGICTKDGAWVDGEGDACKAFDYCEERFRK